MTWSPLRNVVTPGADVDDDASALVAEDRGKQALGVGAREREFVGVADAGRLDLDQHLALARPLEIDLGDFERLSGGDGDGGAGLHAAGSPLQERSLKPRPGVPPRGSTEPAARAVRSDVAAKQPAAETKPGDRSVRIAKEVRSRAAALHQDVVFLVEGQARRRAVVSDMRHRQRAVLRPQFDLEHDRWSSEADLLRAVDALERGAAPQR